MRPPFGRDSLKSRSLRETLQLGGKKSEVEILSQSRVSGITKIGKELEMTFHKNVMRFVVMSVSVLKEGAQITRHFDPSGYLLSMKYVVV